MSLQEEKGVMSNNIGNRLITVSIQAHPLCLNGKEGGKRDEYHHLSVMSPNCSIAKKRM